MYSIVDRFYIWLLDIVSIKIGTCVHNIYSKVHIKEEMVLKHFFENSTHCSGSLMCSATVTFIKFVAWAKAGGDFWIHFCDPDCLTILFKSFCNFLGEGTGHRRTHTGFIDKHAFLEKYDFRHSVHCASGFYNRNQKVHGLFHF